MRLSEKILRLQNEGALVENYVRDNTAPLNDVPDYNRWTKESSRYLEGYMSREEITGLFDPESVDPDETDLSQEQIERLSDIVQSEADRESRKKDEAGERVRDRLPSKPEPLEFELTDGELAYMQGNVNTPDGDEENLLTLDVYFEPLSEFYVDSSRHQWKDNGAYRQVYQNIVLPQLEDLIDTEEEYVQPAFWQGDTSELNAFRPESIGNIARLQYPVEGDSDELERSLADLKKRTQKMEEDWKDVKEFMEEL